MSVSLQALPSFFIHLAVLRREATRTVRVWLNVIGGCGSGHELVPPPLRTCRETPSIYLIRACQSS